MAKARKNPYAVGKKKTAPAPKKSRKGLILGVSVGVLTLLAVVLVVALSGGGKTYYADIVIRDHGTITLELDGKTAPITVENFVTLAESGFYDGLTFHRIVDGFMMQGGDPQGDGYGNSGTTIVGEFSANGYENDISHVRGTVSMARGGYSYDSASCQFFIVQSDSTFLDGQYAAFGHVLSGMEIVDELCAAAGSTDRILPADEQPVIESITTRR